MIASAGYSGTPLLKKLGLKAGMRVCFVDAPPHYAELLGPLPEDSILSQKPSSDMDFIHFFALTQGDMITRFTDLKKHLIATGMLWISWPKKSSLIEPDLSSDIVRSTGLHQGVCSRQGLVGFEVYVPTQRSISLLGTLRVGMA